MANSDVVGIAFSKGLSADVAAPRGISSLKADLGMGSQPAEWPKLTFMAEAY